MRVDVLTLFPGMFEGPLSLSILARAREAGLLAVETHDLRSYADGKHRVTDEPPFGGGGGMVMKPEPIFAGVEALVAAHGPGRVILLSPAGKLLSPEALERGAPDPGLRPVRRGGPARGGPPGGRGDLDRGLRPVGG
jgi:tRNA (guanine37-N1)-methyltransferase